MKMRKIQAFHGACTQHIFICLMNFLLKPELHVYLFIAMFGGVKECVNVKQLYSIMKYDVSQGSEARK